MLTNDKFTVLYSFNVRKGMAVEFVETWTELTKLIYRFEGSFGSRLHRANDDLYIGYALWPDRGTWKASGNRLPKSATELQKRLRECCEVIKTEHELTVVSDQLRSEQYEDQFHK